MILSMTGFGKKEFQYEEKCISVEIRSLNSKNTDITIRTPNYLRPLDPEIRKKLINKMQRGKIDLNIHVEFTGNLAPTSINNKIVKAYMKQLEEIGTSTESERMLMAMRLPEAFSSEKETLSEEEKKILLSNLDKVISDIKDFQKNEGFEMGKDIELRLDLIDSHLKNIVELEPIRIEKIREKLLTSIQSLKIEIDTNRFEQEMIFYLEKFDITEEKVRLMNHIKYFRDVTNENSPNGKKLGFISQEMGREINTIGSKANDAHLQKIVVQMKNELEKIKEQLLNIL
ncbi:MAG: YicC family protein [Flavobacteriaceae bacterium TMED68]|nr:MAG: YicC family protein [Flavobacteriaceae bacterium TMED68]|tara:strand:+ start:19216 stop:20073 length:858 start_codon:yes stop_codon:yes gene_type:complete